MEKKRITDRKAMVRVLLDLLRPLRPFYSAGYARLKLGNTGAHYDDGRAEMEAFARVLWGVGPLLSVPNEKLPEAMRKEIREWEEICRSGLVNGTAPEHPEYWGELTDYDQMMVEMAPIAVALILSPDKFWTPLEEGQKENLYRFLNQINEREVHPNNWIFFRILVNLSFLVIGRPCNADRLKKDMEGIERCYTGGGWYCDGNPSQIDYYIPFAIQFYSLIFSYCIKGINCKKDIKDISNISDISAISDRNSGNCLRNGKNDKENGKENDRENGKEDGAEGEILPMLRQAAEKYEERAGQFFQDFIYWFGTGGREIAYGRSLTYRFAHTCFFGAYLLAGKGSGEYGEIKALVMGNLDWWLSQPVFDNAGVLTIGYGYPNLIMSEAYNAPGSPYWCLKTFLFLALGEEHPFWRAEEKEFAREKRKLLERAQMLIENDGGRHVTAFPAGINCMEHGNCTGKYQKFVYSNLFGFSVARGGSLRELGADNTLAVSFWGEDGEGERYEMKGSCEAYRITEDYTWQKYRITDAVRIETYIIPSMPWHARIHKVTNDRKITLVDAGFSVNEKTEYGADGREAYIVCGSGCSKVLGSGLGEAFIIDSFPNVHLLHHRTFIPAVRYRLEPGEHVIIDYIYGQPAAES